MCNPGNHTNIYQQRKETHDLYKFLYHRTYILEADTTLQKTFHLTTIQFIAL